MKLGYNKTMAILNDDEFTEFEGRSYLNPQVALDESNTFIDNLRQTQQANNQQIKTDTYNLGTEVPSNLGGLTGPESYFTSRYQVPQTNAAISNLRATAQANALNQVLQNEQDMWKKRYQEAYNAYQKRAWDRGNGGGGDDDDDPDFEASEDTLTVGTNDVTVPEESNSGFDKSYAQNSVNAGGGSVPYSVSGTPYILVDKDGNKTGIRIYSNSSTVTGVETPNGSYTGDVNQGIFGGIKYGGGSNLIRNTIASGGKLLDSSEHDISNGWYWRVTH